MIGLILLLGIVLILSILFILYRIQVLVEVVKGNYRKRVTQSNRINAILSLTFLIAGLAAFWWVSRKEFHLYNIPVASEHGVLINNMFWITMIITLTVFFITQILLFYFPYRYRYREGNSALYYPDNNTVEKIWTFVPAVVMTILVVSGLKVWTKITSKPPADAEVVEIMGYQFAWKTRYPGSDNLLGSSDFRLVDATNEMGVDFRDKASFDDVVPREMHLPKGKAVLFKIRSRDVIHSVYSPHFRLKMDAVPGMPTSFWFIPTKSTDDMRRETGNAEFNYEIACTEVCGRGHFSMRLLVVVDEPDQYEKWKSEQKSWLSSNPDYMTKVPEELKELALIRTGLGKQNY
jgi:cytochrome c oxidase subunit 2